MPTYNKSSEYERLSFEVIREPLDTLLIALGNKLEREWPSKWSSVDGASVLLKSIVLVTENTYKSIRFLCADKPENPFRKMEYSISVPPLVRTILDHVFTVVFLFQDLPERTIWYYKSGWRELHDEHQRMLKKYSSDPDWGEWFRKKEDLLKDIKKSWGITPEEEKDPKKIKWWPNPGQMKSHKNLSKDRRDYLTYLNDWYYRELSAASHLSWPGLASRASHLLNPNMEEQKRVLNKFRSDCAMRTITLIIALISEIQIECNYDDFAKRVKYLWGILNAYWGEAKEIYESRYEGLF